ncbi:MBL fold metallo-hydrolase RNA specificity domain-containing protein, partial [Algibacter sp.]|uniref:MBL fold metallo-hydrolase RNA specificity domain-containing protein n=1 Tax=Algibacter sp. TaxID=1872428 RepID=UPI003C7550C8
RQLEEGAHEIKFFGKYYPVKATIKKIESLSAHADQNDLLNWMGGIKNIPERVFLIHGEPAAQDAFRVKIKDTFNWNVTIPKLSNVEELNI